MLISDSLPPLFTSLIFTVFAPLFLIIALLKLKLHEIFKDFLSISGQI